MEFLSLIRDKVCHPEATSLAPGPSLYCNACRRDLTGDVYQYIGRRPHSEQFFSSRLAQAYHAWTGDERVPMSFPLTHLDGILDTVVYGQSVDRVRKSIRLLRALNAPFTASGAAAAAAPPILPEMNTFLVDFLNIIYEHPNANGSTERLALEALIKSMHDLLSSGDAVDVFETYYGTLVPFVKNCAVAWEPLPPREGTGEGNDEEEEEDPNWARELFFQLHRSARIRKVFGKYALPLDVVHVMVCCYACSSDMEVVGNWALDFLAHVCRGDYFWKRFPECPFVQSAARAVDEYFRRNKNRNLFYAVVKPIRSGECVGHYSQMWQPLHELKAALRKKYRVPGLRCGGSSPDAVLDAAFAQFFPTILFERHADQLGFLMAYHHLFAAMNRRTGQLPKGAFAQATRIHEIVQGFVERVLKFEEIPLVWTLDTARLFFASDERLESEVVEVVRLLVREERR